MQVSNIFKLTGLLIIALMVLTCEDFQDETYSMTEVDEQAVSSIGDTLINNLPFAVGSQWIKNYQATLTLDSLLSNYYAVTYDSTSDTVAVDSIVLTIDTTYFFSYVENVTFLDTFKVAAIGIIDTALYYDTTLIHIDTVTASTDTTRYSSGLSFEKDYPLPYIILKYGNGKRDTLSSPAIANSLINVELYSALNTLDAGVGVSDTAYNVQIPVDSTSYCLLSINQTGTHVLYLDHFAAPNIFQVSSNTISMVELASDDMSPELIAGLYDLPGPVPVIKGRYEYELDAGTYLFEIARLEATTKDNFRVVIRREQ